MDQKDILNHWYASIYEQQENQTDDVEFLLKLLGNEPQNVLEVCCGGGRISVPLAKAGHTVTGFDMDTYMLERLHKRASGLDNLKYSAADAIRHSWGENFDAVILGGNILINIECEMEYIDAQRLFIQKAFGCLKKGGHLFLDFDCGGEHDPSFHSNAERVIFDGTDDRETYGRLTIIENAYEASTRTLSGKRRTTIKPSDNEMFVVDGSSSKHFPHWKQVDGWLSDIGFVVEAAYSGYHGEPFTGGKGRATIWARKPL